MRNTGLRLAALLTVLGLTPTACGGAPEPPPPPKAQPSPSSTATPTAEPTAPAMPAKAREKTKAGALAFGRYYVTLVNAAQATGDVSGLAEVEAAGCNTCAQSRQAIERLYAEGATVTGGDWSVDSSMAHSNPATGGWLLELVVSFGPQMIDRGGTAPDVKLGGGRLPVNLQLIWRGDSWRVLESTRGA